MSITSYRESILANLKTALETISTDNGYNSNPGTIERGSRSIEATRSFPALYLPGGNSEHEPMDYANDKVTFRPSILGYVNDRLDAASKLNELAADVERVVLLDPTRGSFAMTCWIDTVIDWVQDNFGQFEITLVIEFIYLRSGG